MHTDLIEISDLIVDFHPTTLQRLPVVKSVVMNRLRSAGDPRAVRIVEAIPEQNGILVEQAVDSLLIRVHYELQRISEEFEHGQRVLDLLDPLLSALRRCGAPRPLRIVDIGCGAGYVVRWLAAHQAVASDCELIGVDYNAALVEEAARLARLESLRCSFLAANAFEMEEEATVYLSTGVLHHFREQGLIRFFAQHDMPAARAFLHFDFQPSLLAPVGSWIFHAARMRTALARHDGVISAVRAHTGETLVNAARKGAPGFSTAMYSTRLWRLPIPRAFHTLVGIRTAYHNSFVQALGSRSSRLARFS